MRVLLVVSLLLGHTACGSFTSREKYLERGNAFSAKGQWDDAALQYRKALQKDPKYGEAYYRLGLAHIRRGSDREAFSALRQAVELPSPYQDDAKAQLGDLTLSAYARDPQRPAVLYQTAERMADELLRKNPQSYAGLRLRGNLAMAASRPREAAGFFQQADRAKPDQPDLVFSLVQALLLDRQDQAAEARALQLMEKKPDYGPIYDALYGQYRRTGRDREAEAVLRKKAAANPNVPFYATQLAEFYWSTARKPEAEALIAALPATAESQQEAGNLYGRLREWEAAVAAYRRALASQPKDAAALRRLLVSALLEQGKNAEAAVELDELLRLNPEDSEALASRAFLRMASGKAGDAALAIEAFRKLTGKHPQNASYRYQLARALRESGQASEGRKELQQVLKLNPQHREALGDLASLSITSEDAGAALEYAQKALAVDPKDPRTRLVRTAAWALQGQFSDVRQELGKLITEFPTLPEPRIQMGLLELAERNYEAAARIFQQQYKPGLADIRPLKGLAEVAFARNRGDEAFALVDQEYRRAASQSGAPPRALVELAAVTADRAGRRAATLEAYDKLVTAYPPRAADLVRLGQLAQAEGDAGKAEAALKKARQVAPADPLPPAVLGALYAESGRWEEAVRSYRESLALRPDDPGVMNNLSFALADRGAALDEALVLARKAVEKAPEQPEFADTLGYVYLKRNEVDSAIQTFRSVVRRTGTAQARLRLAVALQKKGDKQQARMELEQALKMNPPREEAEMLRKTLENLR